MAGGGELRVSFTFSGLSAPRACVRVWLVERQKSKRGVETALCAVLGLFVEGKRTTVVGKHFFLGPRKAALLCQKQPGIESAHVGRQEGVKKKTLWTVIGQEEKRSGR